MTKKPATRRRDVVQAAILDIEPVNIRDDRDEEDDGLDYEDCGGGRRIIRDRDDE